jgi:hypothetical protein
MEGCKLWEDEEGDVNSYWMTLRKREGGGELALKEGLELS